MAYVVGVRGIAQGDIDIAARVWCECALTQWLWLRYAWTTVSAELFLPLIRSISRVRETTPVIVQIHFFVQQSVILAICRAAAV